MTDEPREKYDKTQIDSQRFHNKEHLFSRHAEQRMFINIYQNGEKF